jgi:hypothetical protein
MNRIMLVLMLLCMIIMMQIAAEEQEWRERELLRRLRKEISY